jgi:hypothetical protein
MSIDICWLPENQRVLQYLQGKGSRYTEILELPNQVKDPYFSQGSHPEIVERVWESINSRLQKDSRILIYGSPCLVNPDNGIIFVICNGTQYNIRLIREDFKIALIMGLKTTTKWSNGEIMDSVIKLGDGWIFGGWKDEETEWCINSYKQEKWLNNKEV